MPMLLSPVEKTVLTFLAGTDPAARATLERADEQEWQRVLETAQRSQLAPFLYYQLREEEINPPPEIRERLRRGFLASAVKNVRHAEQVGTILDILAEVAVTPVLLKGSALAFSIYPDPACRPMGDIDILVRKDELETCIEALKHQGYTEICPTAAPLSLRLSQEKHVALSPPDNGGKSLELHWDPFEPPIVRSFRTGTPLDHAANLESIAVEGRLASVFTSEIAFIHAAMHFAGHQFQPDHHRTLLDLVLLGRSRAISWESVVRNVRKGGLAIPVGLTLCCLHDELGCEEAAAARQELTVGRMRRSVAMLLAGRIRRVVNGRPALQWLTLQVVVLFTWERLRHSLAYLKARLWPSEQTLACRFERTDLKTRLRLLLYRLPMRMLHGGKCKL